MEKIIVHSRLSPEEKETILHYDTIDKVWVMDSTVPRHYSKALKQKWKPITEYVYEDGTVCGMVLTASERSVTIRSTDKKKMSEKQMKNLSSSDKDDEDDE
jgi:hypothetical protein